MLIKNISANLLKYFGNTRNIIIIFVACVFLIAAIFIIKKYIHSTKKNAFVANNEYKPVAGLESVDMYLFYTTWCPHCKTTKPVWDKFKQEYTNKTVNGVTIHFFEIDCDKDTATSEKYKITGYPTIKMIKGSSVIDFEASPSVSNLNEFIEATLMAK